MSDDVSRVKEAINIVDVIGEFVELKKAGKNYKGLCPFHKEKTPSFVVSEERGTFMCFGCHEAGDVFSFLMKRDNMTFPEALEYLADKAGITLENTIQNRQKKIDFEKYYKINEDARKFFYQNLLTYKPARDYLRNRKINDYTINEFSLGYAPDSWDILTNHMTKIGHKLEDLVELGLVARSQNGRYYDVYRNRLIFPIYNIRDRIIGFGGRTLANDRAKYINSPESEIYHKGSQLYGLNLIHKENNRDRIILVEGYMDVIGLRQNGFKNTVAALGTALTDQQVKLASRYAKEVYLSYDSDSAGIKASLRAIESFTDKGIFPKVISLEEGLDPDDYIKEYSSEAYEKKIKEADNHIDFQLNLITKNTDVTDPGKMTDTIKNISEIINPIKSEVVKDEYIQKVSKKLGINPMSLANDLGKFTIKPQVQLQPRIEKDTKDLPQTLILALKFSIKSKDYYEGLKTYIKKLDLYELGYIFEYIQEKYENDKELSLEQMADELNFTENRYKLLKFDNIENEAEAYNELLFRIKRLDLEEERDKLKSTISMLVSIIDSNPDKQDELRELIQRLTEIELALKTK